MSAPISDAGWQDPYPEPKPSRFAWLRHLWILPGLLVAGIIVLVLLDRWHWPEDPEYQGRRLSSWMTDLSSAQPAEVQQARLVVQAIGTNAVPILVVHLGARDSVLGRLAVASEKFLPRPLWVGAMQVTRSRDSVERRTQAARALAALGPASLPALPDLARAIEDPEPRAAAAAAEALRLMGPPAWPELVRTLRSTNDYAFDLASTALHQTGTAASNTAAAVVAVLLQAPAGRREVLSKTLARLGPASVPPLGAALAESEPGRREVAAATLRILLAAEFQCLRAVAGLLESPDALVRAGAAQVLSAPAVWGRTSIMALTKALQDPVPEVRTAAAGALGAATAWTDQATNALTALRALAAGSGPDATAAAGAVRLIEERVPGR